MLIGAARPRVEVRPSSISYSFGEEAAELYRRSGQDLDPWQEQGVELMLSVRADGKWACRDYAEWVARQNGKGPFGEVRVLAGLFLLGEQLLMWSAHQYKTAMEMFLRVKERIRMLEENGVLQKGIVKTINTNGEEGFEVYGDQGLQRLKFIARSNVSGRGFSGDTNVIDEAFAYTMKQDGALRPTQRARPNPQTIYLSTPPLDGESGEVMYKLRARAEAGAPDGRLGYRDWGNAGDLAHLVEQAIDLEDRELWAQANPALGIRIQEEDMISDRAAMSDEDFARELLGIWPERSNDNITIDRTVWAGLADPSSKRSGPLAVAFDVAPHRDFAAVVVYAERADGLGHAQLVDYRPGVKWLVARLIELKKDLTPIVFVAGRGTAESLKEDLNDAGITLPEDPDKPQRGDLAIPNAVEVGAAVSGLLDAIRQKSFRHVPQAQLESAVVGGRTRQNTDSLVWSRKDSTSDIGPLVALTYGRWAFHTRTAALAGREYDVLSSVC